VPHYPFRASVFSHHGKRNRKLLLEPKETSIFTFSSGLALIANSQLKSRPPGRCTWRPLLFSLVVNRAA
jgi:hypothetical protein